MESALERALNDSSSPVYKSNNWKSIQRYLKPKGIIIPKDDILRYLEKQKFSEIRYKNEGLQKVSQLGKQHATRAKFFSIMQADVLVLSKKKHNTLSMIFFAILVPHTRVFFIIKIKQEIDVFS